MFFSPQEKCFLVTFTVLVLISLLCTSSAIMLDKHAITGTAKNPSTCMLTDSTDCRTVYTNDVARKVIEVSVRVDLYLSIIAFVTSVVLTTFKIFNCRFLIGFLLTGIFKTLFVNTALILILTNSGFYFNTVYNTLTGACGHNFCLEDQTANIVVSFVLLSSSAIATFIMTLNVLFLGSHILRKYDEIHNEYIWSKWDAMTADLIAF